MTNPIPENKPGSRQFEETMQVFESMHHPSAVREAPEYWKLRAFYADGKINEEFKGFLAGITRANLVK